MRERIQLRRDKGWRKPEGAVVVARPTKWGNPFAVGDDIVVQGHALRVTPDLAVALYRVWVHQFAEDARQELAGHDLACWCPATQPCHADVLLELANPDSIA
ncbi:hypothetical protein MSIMFB_01496 [Mycobacterium simulans]|uniref:DUF4326 domain-containing protein n=1 Tax=Mycobacterium simulans TaxID=627089 RepID=A0A7Z7IKF9_9MYCO|nr:DUF4326 domain-containing protein [Mycobacterium simulans]SOJ53999.1 hypothetical protein MSIMFB_01496 [Mycobacterium simulans]